MEPQPLVSREELTGIFFVIADIAADIRRIVKLLEEEFGGEAPEEDA